MPLTTGPSSQPPHHILHHRSSRHLPWPRRQVLLSSFYEGRNWGSEPLRLVDHTAAREGAAVRGQRRSSDLKALGGRQMLDSSPSDIKARAEDMAQFAECLPIMHSIAIPGVSCKVSTHPIIQVLRRWVRAGAPRSQSDTQWQIKFEPSLSYMSSCPPKGKRQQRGKIHSLYCQGKKEGEIALTRFSTLWKQPQASASPCKSQQFGLHEDGSPEVAHGLH